MLQAYRQSEVTFLRAPALESIPGVVHGFSTRHTHRGANAGSVSDGFIRALGLGGWPVGRLKQIHSNRVHRIESREFASALPEGDAAFTDLPGMLLEVRTADCVPILIAGRTAHAVGVAHAGWRGTLDGVTRRLVNTLQVELDVDASQLAVAIGPHIGVCCFEVGEEVFDSFDDPDVFERRTGWRRPHLDLATANRQQLVDAGVRDEMIEISHQCTRCRPDLFHSYRRDGDHAGRMLSVVGIEP